MSLRDREEAPKQPKQLQLTVQEEASARQLAETGDVRSPEAQRRAAAELRGVAFCLRRAPQEARPDVRRVVGKKGWRSAVCWQGLGVHCGQALQWRTSKRPAS